MTEFTEISVKKIPENSQIFQVLFNFIQNSM